MRGRYYLRAKPLSIDADPAISPKKKKFPHARTGFSPALDARRVAEAMRKKGFEEGGFVVHRKEEKEARNPSRLS